MITAGVGLMAVVEGAAVRIAVLMAGAVRDGFMAIFVTSVTESEGVGPAHAGTALGLAMTFASVRGLVAPPLGSSLARYDLRLPFLLWAAMALLRLAGLSWVKDRAVQAGSPPAGTSRERVRRG